MAALLQAAGRVLLGLPLTPVMPAPAWRCGGPTGLSGWCVCTRVCAPLSVSALGHFAHVDLGYLCAMELGDTRILRVFSTQNDAVT